MSTTYEPVALPVSAISYHDLLSRPSESKYSDPFICIDSSTRTLTIKHNGLIIPSSLSIPIDVIDYVLPAPECVRYIGMGEQLGLEWFNWVNWGMDWRRGPNGWERSWIVKYGGKRLRVGFSVKDREAFFRAMEGLRPGVMSKSKDCAIR